jgi:tagatose-1,6-bisphosphate aldolase
MQLSDFQTPQGFFTIAPFDHRASLAQTLHLDLAKSEDQEKFIELKRLFISIFSPHVSAVLTDPDFGIKTLADKAANCGLFLSLEESGYSGDHDAMTVIKKEWGVDQIKEHGGGAKLLVYFNPQSKTAAEKLELVRKLFVECKDKEVVFLVEPVLYSLPDQKQWQTEMDAQWTQVYLEVCRSFAPFCDILKIQYPGSQEACKEVSTFHSNWILLSRGVDFETFCTYLTTAVRQGCNGYAAGRAVWQEISGWTTVAEWKTFLETTAVERLKKLNEIIKTARLVA